MKTMCIVHLPSLSCMTIIALGFIEAFRAFSVKSASFVTLHLRDRICNAFHKIAEMHLRLGVGRL